MKKFNVFLIVLTGIMSIAANAMAGPYASSGYTTSDAAFVGWASSVIDYSGYSSSSVENILGEKNGTVAVGSSSGGYVTLGFDTAITDGNGDDFAIWENGFVINGTGGLVYAELGYVSVSTDGENWATFSSVSLTEASSNPYVDPSDVYNLAGNFKASEGTGFDLSDLADNDAVIGNLVDLSTINYIMITDVVSGTDTDSLGNVIYDGMSYGGGADWDAVGVINAVPVPGAVILFCTGLLGMLGIRRRK